MGDLQIKSFQVNYVLCSGEKNSFGFFKQEWSAQNHKMVWKMAW